MHLDYTRLFELLKQQKISFPKFKKAVNITEAEEWMLKTNGQIRAETIFRICQYLRCDIKDILEVDGHLL